MSLQVWLPLNGDLHNQGLSNITVTNNGATINNNGKIGKCYSINDTIDLGYSGSNLNTNSISLCCWVRFNTNDIASIINNQTYTSTFKSSNGNILGNNSYGGFSLQWYSNDIYISGSFSSIGVQCHLRTSTVGAKTTSNINLPLDTWNHLCAICDKTLNKCSLYLNGNLQTFFNFNTFTDATDRTFKLNYRATAGGNYNTPKIPILMNDVRIYDHALSAKEIEEIAKGLVLHYKLDQPNQNLLTNDWDLTTWSKESGISVSWDNTVGMYKVLDSSHTSSRWGIYQNITLTANTTYTFSVDGMKKDQKVNFGFAEGTSWPANAGSFTTTVSRLSKTITVGDADANCRIYLNINPVTDGSNYGYFRAPKLEIGAIATSWNSHTDNNTIYDSSGYGNNGTIIGNLTIYSNSPRYNIATAFDGTNAIKYTNFNLGNIWSAGLWFNATSGITSGWDSLFAVNSNGGDSDLKMNLYLNTANGNIQYSANGQYIVVSAAPNKDTWYHIFETFDGTTLSCYVNGVLKTTKTITNTEFTRSNLHIGGRSTSTNGSISGNKFRGKLSDFRIYATVLSANDILELYNTSMSIDKNGNIHARELVEL